jgi:WD40 repeat protein
MTTTFGHCFGLVLGRKDFCYIPFFEKKNFFFQKKINAPLFVLETWDSQPDATVTAIKGGRSSAKCFASAWTDRIVRVFTLGVTKPVLELGGLDSQCTGLAFNHAEEVLAGGDENGGVTLWSLKQGKVARKFENGGGSKTVTDIAFHPSGVHAVVAGHDMMTRVWDLREQKCVQTYSAHERTTSISFSPGAGAYIVSGGSTGLAKVNRLLFVY